jgi:hypothetical protein
MNILRKGTALLYQATVLLLVLAIGLRLSFPVLTGFNTNPFVKFSIDYSEPIDERELSNESRDGEESHHFSEFTLSCNKSIEGSKLIACQGEAQRSAAIHGPAPIYIVNLMLRI